jgi:hypothetical protein
MDNSQILQILSGLGAINPAVGVDGVIPVTNTSQVQVISKTSPATRGTNVISKPNMNLSFPPCIFGFEPWCQRWVKGLMDPTLLFDITPLQMTNVAYHISKGYVEGDVQTKFSNSSTPGQTFEKNEKTGEVRNQLVVAGSADLAGNLSQQITALDTSTLIDTVQNEIQALAGTEINVQGHWSHSGVIDEIVTFVKMLITGKIHTTHGIDTTLSYNFNGTQTTTKHIDTEVWLPVNGSISYIWFN